MTDAHARFGKVLSDLRTSARSLMSRAGMITPRCLGHVLGGVRAT
jgi:hypothetical protein